MFYKDPWFWLASINREHSNIVFYFGIKYSYDCMYVNDALQKQKDWYDSQFHD